MAGDDTVFREDKNARRNLTGKITNKDKEKDNSKKCALRSTGYAGTAIRKGIINTAALNMIRKRVLYLGEKPRLMLKLM